MKNIITIIISLGLLTACGIKEGAVEIGEDIQNSYDNVVEEVGEVSDKINETKAKAEETIDDINTAVDKVKDAKEAIDEITE